MGLGMENFNISGVHWKIRLLGGSSWKTNIEGGGLSKKGGLGQFADLIWAWQERGGGVFEGGWYPDAHYGNYWYILNKWRIVSKHAFLLYFY